jgi:hypothetical protein
MVGRSIHLAPECPRAIAGIGSGTQQAAPVDREDRHNNVDRWHGPVARSIVLVAVAGGVLIAGIGVWTIIAVVVGVPWPEGVPPTPLLAPPGLGL